MVFVLDGTAWYFLEQDNMYPGVNFNAFNPVDPATNGRVDVQDDHAQYVVLPLPSLPHPIPSPHSLTLTPSSLLTHSPPQPESSAQ